MNNQGGWTLKQKTPRARLQNALTTIPVYTYLRIISCFGQKWRNHLERFDHFFWFKKNAIFLPGQISGWISNIQTHLISNLQLSGYPTKLVPGLSSMVWRETFFGCWSIITTEGKDTGARNLGLVINFSNGN